MEDFGFGLHGVWPFSARPSATLASHEQLVGLEATTPDGCLSFNSDVLSLIAVQDAMWMCYD